MKLRFRRWFSSILSIFFGSAIVLSCAPAPAYAAAYMGPPEVYINGKVKNRDTMQAIADIRLSLIVNSVTNSLSSEADGAYAFYSSERTFTILAYDNDGTNNGAYLPTNFSMTVPSLPYYYNTNIDILMTTNTNG
ncbi:MAG: hypothetical protein A2014_05415 [Spirochaetes bacterium GWF1_49_6]|nr:MAG: hypothetical protein A2014_05415 [Spirochaetes bacterium GWF1_49_6]